MIKGIISVMINYISSEKLKLLGWKQRKTHNDLIQFIKC